MRKGDGGSFRQLANWNEGRNKETSEVQLEGRTAGRN